MGVYVVCAYVCIYIYVYIMYGNVHIYISFTKFSVSLMHSSNIGYCMVTSYIFKLINHFTVFSKYSLLFVRLIYRYFM